MGGFSSVTGLETIMFADNASFNGTQRNGAMTTNGQLWIGSSTSPHVKVGTLGSTDNSITWTVGSGTITGQVAGGTTVLKTLTPDSGGVQSPTAGNINMPGSGSITTVGSGSTITTQLTGLTNHAVLVGAGTATITKVGPVASTGAVLMSNGLASDPGFSTATYPAIATGTGTILRADGTNWVATTSTYPNTNAINTLLYASAANVMSALATANSGVLTTSATGVPSIDTTNFAVLTTGVQMKGNNTNTAPPAGFIGEQIRGFLAVGSSVTVVTTTAKTVTSITLTPGIWDISAVLVYNPAAITGVQTVIDISTTTNTLGGTSGDSQIQLPTVPTSAAAVGLTIPSFRVTIASNTTYFLIAFATFSAGTLTANGRISGTRVG